MKIINIDILDNINLKTIEDLQTGQTKNIESGFNIPTDNVNNVILNFNFMTPDAIVDGLHLFAIFKSSKMDKAVTVELKELTIEDRSFTHACYMPAETLLETGIVTLGVYGYVLNEDESLDVRISLRPISYNVVTGSYDKNTTMAIVPTPTVFETYFNQVYETNQQMETNLAEYNTKLDTALEEFKTQYETDYEEYFNEVSNVNTLMQNNYTKYVEDLNTALGNFTTTCNNNLATYLEEANAIKSQIQTSYDEYIAKLEEAQLEIAETYATKEYVNTVYGVVMEGEY